MGYKAISSIVVLMICSRVFADVDRGSHSYDTHVTVTAATPGVGKPHQHHHHNHSNADDDGEIAKLAISTLASMAKDIVTIGLDPHNPQAIGSGVINMLSSFVNFVVYALKNPKLLELMEDEQFQDRLRVCILRSIAEESRELVPVTE